jgi:hypothetical protein
MSKIIKIENKIENKIEKEIENKIEKKNEKKIEKKIEKKNKTLLEPDNELNKVLNNKVDNSNKLLDSLDILNLTFLNFQINKYKLYLKMILENDYDLFVRIYANKINSKKLYLSKHKIKEDKKKIIEYIDKINFNNISMLELSNILNKKKEISTKQIMKKTSKTGVNKDKTNTNNLDLIIKTLNNEINIDINKLPDKKYLMYNPCYCDARAFDKYFTVTKVNDKIIYGRQCKIRKKTNEKYCGNHLKSIPHGNFNEEPNDLLIEKFNIGK